MTDYVCGFMRDKNHDVALVRKLKPKWQAGCLNGIGGAIESDEAPWHAMRREWKEETGHEHLDWTQFATLMVSNGSLIHFFKAEVVLLPSFPSHNDIGESLEVCPYDVAIRTPTGGMIQNLKWLLPMAFEDPDAKANVMMAA